MSKESKSIKRGAQLCLVMVALWVASLVPNNSHSSDLKTAVHLAADGKFYEASEVAAGVESAEGFTLAARALAIFGYEIAPKSDKQELFLRAIEYAKKAVELNPESSSAALEISHTLGRYAQTIGVAEALTGGYAEKTKTAMERAIQLDPRNFRAHLSIGSWNAEIVAAAGFMAKLLYDATEENALLAYQRALDLSPNSIVVHYEYAFGLMRLGDKNLDLAISHLEKALNLTADDAYGLIVQEKATRLLKELKMK